MPAKKPKSLTKRHDTKKDRQAREDGEKAFTPRTSISKTAPAALKGHARAVATWRRLVGLYFETEGTIITAFDEDLLIKYCLAEEELGELYKIRGEILKLHWSHLDLARRTLTILEQKNGARDTLPVNETAIAVLQTRAAVRTSNTEAVFLNGAGHPRNARNLLRAFYPVMREAGITRFRFHDLRHTFATRLSQAWVDV